MLSRTLHRYRQQSRQIGPGIAACLVVAMAARFLSEHYGGPVMLFALLIGMALHFLYLESRCHEGIEYSGRAILRFGVALLGARLTLEQIQAFGPTPVLIVVSGVAATLLFGWLVSRWFGQSRGFGILTGGAVAICGASAALAISAVLKKGKVSDRDTIFTVVSVTALSTLAMIVYPILANWLALDTRETSVLLGGTIHDVAQVIGAGYLISDEVGDLSSVIKLLRVAMLVPVMLLLAVWVGRSDDTAEQAGSNIPWFILGFTAMVALNSLGLLTPALRGLLIELSNWCLVTAIAALGLKTQLKELAAVGLRPLALMVSETLFLFLFVLLLIKLL
ncbi:YeiH family protein [Motiliproteus sediminis]|uniref:YeiH family protein n=1 Tax=Motiliproteus sediminis TaxID=1468178 RepID=UPI001AEF922E|nr:YeiH family protein [Motiliproteus sediminis]